MLFLFMVFGKYGFDIGSSSQSPHGPGDTHLAAQHVGPRPASRVADRVWKNSRQPCCLLPFQVSGSGIKVLLSGSLHTKHAIAHLRSVDPNEEIVEYLSRIDATLEPFGGRFIIHGALPQVMEDAFEELGDRRR